MQRENILAFHAITGSDTTSKLATVSKPAAWARYLKSSDLLSGLGNHPLEEPTISYVEKFVVQLYKVSTYKYQTKTSLPLPTIETF